MSDKLTIFHNDGTTTEVEPIKPWSPCTCCPKCQEKLKMIPKLILQNGRLAEEKYSLQAENRWLKTELKKYVEWEEEDDRNTDDVNGGGDGDTED